MGKFEKKHGYKKGTYETKLREAGIPQSAWGGYGKNVNPKEYQRILGAYDSSRVVSPSVASPAGPSLENQLTALREKYTGMLTPTAGETEAQTQLRNIITSRELGVAKAEAEPMAQKFVTGQATALEKSAALKSLPLQTRLATLQSQRAAAADVLKTQMGFAEAGLERETEEKRYQAEERRYEAERAEEQERYETSLELSAQERKDALKSTALSLGISTKTKKGGTLSTKKLEDAIAKYYKEAGLARTKSEAIDLALKQKQLSKTAAAGGKEDDIDEYVREIEKMMRAGLSKDEAVESLFGGRGA